MAQGGHGFQRHVAGALDDPFVVLFQEDCADEPDDGVVVGEDADDLGPPFDFAVEPFESTGMREPAPKTGCERRACGVWCDHPGQRRREYEGVGSPINFTSRELELVAGRLCDSPGCAASANP
jgi:hypothetical protein